MRRLLLRTLGVAVCTWIQWAIFPGHTFLHGGTQLSVPMLERLANPGFLSRDIVATHSDLEYTAYDEITLSLAETTRRGLEGTLKFQQIASRAAGVFGILLLALSLGANEVSALFITFIVNLGALLTGPGVVLLDAEPIPRALAWGPLVLAVGLLAREKPLLAGVCAGIALLYDPALAAPLGIFVLIILIADRKLRRLFRPAFTVICVFALLLANMAQLQPGIVERQPIFSKVSASFAAIQRFRTPEIWVSAWPRAAAFIYIAVWVCGVWAFARIWPSVNRQCRWMLTGLSTLGVAGIALSYVWLDRLQWAFVPHIEPAHWLLFTVAFTELACLAAAMNAVRKRRFIEALLWLILPFSAVLHRSLLGQPKPPNAPDTRELATWVRQNTWGSSMFLFPDLGRSSAAGEFRALSQRAVWVDWNSGELLPLFQSFASTWYERWDQAMQPAYSPGRLQADLSLPIDYYVLTRAHRLAGVQPVFGDKEFVVYDANDLRSVNMPLRTADPR